MWFHRHPATIVARRSQLSLIPSSPGGQGSFSGCIQDFLSLYFSALWLWCGYGWFSLLSSSLELIDLASINLCFSTNLGEFLPFLFSPNILSIPLYIFFLSVTPVTSMLGSSEDPLVTEALFVLFFNISLSYFSNVIIFFLNLSPALLMFSSATSNLLLNRQCIFSF